jgi:hypothetical protein
MTCESCYWMRGKLPFKYRNPNEFDFFRYVCHCHAGMLRTHDGKKDRTFEVGGRFRMKDTPRYEAWRVAQNCLDYKSMD